MNTKRASVKCLVIPTLQQQVFNLLGQLVKTERNTNEISVEDMAGGVYLLRIIDTKGTAKTERISVTK